MELLQWEHDENTAKEKKKQVKLDISIKGLDRKNRIVILMIISISQLFTLNMGIYLEKHA